MSATLDEKRACAARELAMRRNVYSGRVKKGKMTPEVADRELRVMAAILHDYQHADLIARPLAERLWQGILKPLVLRAEFAQVRVALDAAHAFLSDECQPLPETVYADVAALGRLHGYAEHMLLEISRFPAEELRANAKRWHVRYQQMPHHWRRLIDGAVAKRGERYLWRRVTG